jgi:transposase
VSTIANQPPVGRRRRRVHSDDFKANAVASRMQPSISMAAVAMANGINSNLLRRWVRETEKGHGAARPGALVASQSRPAVTTRSFVPVPLPTQSASPDIRIELRRGATCITVTWPTDAAAECAAWMRELLR